MKKTVLALALAAGLTSFAGSAKASIVFNPNPNFSVTGDYFATHNLLPHDDNGAGFYLIQNNPQAGQYIDFGNGDGFYSPGYSSSAYLSAFASYFTPATLGDTISSNSSFGSGYGLDNGTQYVGFYLIDANNNNQTYNGWLQATVSGVNSDYGDVSFTLDQFAYDNTGASIMVGQTEATPAAVPEPSQVAASLLLVAGIAGFVIVRRQKNALAQVA